MKISLVAAVARAGVIGRDGGLPWHLPDDLKRFKRLTSGHCIVMGRRTYESIGRPLPQRTSIVLTRGDALEPAESLVIVRSLDEALAAARGRGEDEAFVVGGAALYALALTRADTLHLTRIDASVAGDVRIPELETAALEARGWKCLESEAHPADSQHEHAFSFERWQKG